MPWWSSSKPHEPAITNLIQKKERTMKPFLSYLLFFLSTFAFASETIIHRGSTAEIYSRFSVYPEFKVDYKSKESWVDLNVTEPMGWNWDITKIELQNLSYDPMNGEVKFADTVCAKIKRGMFSSRLVVPTDNCRFEMRYIDGEETYELILHY